MVCVCIRFCTFMSVSTLDAIALDALDAITSHISLFTFSPKTSKRAFSRLYFKEFMSLGVSLQSGSGFPRYWPTFVTGLRRPH